jgi:hypothetical protein
VQVVLRDPEKAFLAHVSELIDGATVEDDPVSLIDVVLDTDPCVAVIVAVCDEVTAATVAEKGALFAPDGIVTEAGTETAPLLLPRVTTNPLDGAAAVKLTVQLSVPAPVNEEVAQLTPDRDGVPFEPLPCSHILLNLVVLDLYIVVRLSVPEASVVDFALY